MVANSARASTGSESSKRKRRRTVDTQSPTEREEYLAKNRTAANKSRKKKREWIQTLEDDLQQKKLQNSSLRDAVDILRQQRAHAKTMCLQHQGCNCSEIRQYLNATLDAHIATIRDVPAQHYTGDPSFGLPQWGEYHPEASNGSVSGQTSNPGMQYDASNGSLSVRERSQSNPEANWTKIDTNGTFY